MFLVPGSGNKPLGREIASITNCDVVDFETRRFPDGERYIRFVDDVPKETAIIVQSFGGAPDDLMVELIFLCKTLQDLGARKLIGVFPYLPYLRQDTRFKPGEAVSAQIMASIIEFASISHILTVDSHLHRISEPNEVFNVPTASLSAMPALASYLKKNYQLKDPIVVAPDVEAAQWAAKVASVLGTDFYTLEKTRLDDSSVRVKSKRVDPVGRDVILVDDIISTGGTIAQVASQFRRKGVARIYALITHGLLADGAYEKVSKAGIYALIMTNTVPNPYCKVTVAPVIVQTLNDLRTSNTT
jgi:ribose-phosphate pyrophosphokinase